MSLRWRALARGLFHAVVVERGGGFGLRYSVVKGLPGHVDESMALVGSTVEDVSGFLSVLSWMIQGKITDGEFRALCDVWHGRASKDSQAAIRSPASESATAVEYGLCAELLTLGCTEDDIDLMLGLVINEDNRAFVFPLKA